MASKPLKSQDIKLFFSIVNNEESLKASEMLVAMILEKAAVGICLLFLYL